MWFLHRILGVCGVVLCLCFGCQDALGPGAPTPCQSDVNCHGKERCRGGVCALPQAEPAPKEKQVVQESPPRDEPPVRRDAPLPPTPEPSPEPHRDEPVPGPEPRLEPGTQDAATPDALQDEPLRERPPEPRRESVPEQPPLLPTWQDDPCANAPSPGYGSTIARWTAQDKKSLPPPGGIVAVGSSSIRFWKRIQLDLSDWQVTQRGYGGSLLWDTAAHAARIITPYKPRAVLVYAGTNDLAVGASPASVLRGYRCLVQKLRQGLGRVHIAFIGITPNPARWQQWPKAKQVNDGVKALSQGWAGLHYIDIPGAFLKTGQPPDAKLFVADRLHLNAIGYALWTAVIEPQLRRIAPPRAYTAPPNQPVTGDQVLIDLGPSNPADGDATKSPDSAGRHWNNWHSLEGGTTTLPGEALGLQTTKGKATPWRLELAGIFSCNGKLNGGLLTPDPKKLGSLGVATATQDYLYTLAASGAQALTIRGLDPTKTYALELFASRSSAQETRITRYTVHAASGASTSQLKTTGRDIGSDGKYDGNDSHVASFPSLRPTSSGKLHVEVSVAQGSFGYLSAIRLIVK